LLPLSQHENKHLQNQRLIVLQKEYTSNGKEYTPSTPIIVGIILQHLDCLYHNQPSNYSICCCNSMDNITSNTFGFKKAMQRDSKRRSPYICSSSNKLHSQLIIFVKSQVSNILLTSKLKNK